MIRPAAILFDCDGVLADSEGLVNRIVAEDLTERGWRISAEQCQETFLGMAVTDMIPVIQQRTGPLPHNWPALLSERIGVAMAEELEAVPGAPEAVRAVVAAGFKVACASNSARSELRAKLLRLGLIDLFEGRLFSYQDVVRPKPAPDMYLAAAADCGAAPAECVVVEDSLLGAEAGIAAGCRVLGLARTSDASVLAAAGAQPFFAMAELPALLGITP